MQKTTTLFTGISKNILYHTRDPSSDIIIADFGIAKHLDSSDNQLTSFTGSFEYVAPEILTHKGHGKPMDMWSIRIITYIILSLQQLQWPSPAPAPPWLLLMPRAVSLQAEP
ncbi:kinase-like domain-containing protein [Russula compacta]|nr:kinase-like domain-containing protein [Russula compacta]